MIAALPPSFRHRARHGTSPSIGGQGTARSTVRLDKARRLQIYSGGSSIRSSSSRGTRLFRTTLLIRNAVTHELLRAAQLLRRQRGAHVGFDQWDIRGTNRTIRIHVFAEI